MINILYFASLRERIGVPAEELELATGTTILDIMEILKSRHGAWAEAFGNEAKVLVAVNQEMTSPGESVKDGDEVAFFPPVTGG